MKWLAMIEEKVWFEFDKDITLMVGSTLKRTSKRKLEVMVDLIYDFEKSEIWHSGTQEATDGENTKQAAK